MTNAARQGATLSRCECGCGRCDVHKDDFPRRRQHLSRPSQFTRPSDSAAALALYRYDLDQWVVAPPGAPMPLPAEYGLALAAPSSDEVAWMWGGAS